MQTNKIVGTVNAATEILGDKWTPLILRVFFNVGIVKFLQLQEILDINPRTLSARLTSLEMDGIISKSFPSPSSHCEYALTKKGRSLFQILKAMEEWSTDRKN